MAISDLDRHSFPASSATPVLPWLALLFAAPGRLFGGCVAPGERRATSDWTVHLSDHELMDLGLTPGPREGRRSHDPAVLRMQRWLGTFPD